MDIDQCVEVMRSLKEAYQRISQSGGITTDKVFKLRHTVTEIELVMISIKKNMEIIETKWKLSKKTIKQENERGASKN